MEDCRVSSLYIVLKDHANESLLIMFTKSQLRVLQREASNEGIELEGIQLNEGQPTFLTTLKISSSMGEKVRAGLVEATRAFGALMNFRLVDERGNGGS